MKSRTQAGKVHDSTSQPKFGIEPLECSEAVNENLSESE
jgi:hypothetical protein